jgi:hypothetical protein
LLQQPNRKTQLQSFQQRLALAHDEQPLLGMAEAAEHLARRLGADAAA